MQLKKVFDLRGAFQQLKLHASALFIRIEFWKDKGMGSRQSRRIAIEKSAKGNDK